MLNKTKVEFELISDIEIFQMMLTCIYSLAECLRFLRDIVKPAISIWDLSTKEKNPNILYT